MPSVDYFHFVGRKERYGRLTRAIWPKPRSICIVHNATTQYPFAMVDAASISPTTSHSVTTVHDLGFSYWPHVSCNRCFVVDEDAARDMFRQKS
jgi:hypothetical protein